jgi:hypothetical protein
MKRRVFSRACQYRRGPFVVGVEGGTGPPEPEEDSMARYMFSVHSVAGGGVPEMTEEEMQQGWQKINILEEEMKSSGALVFSGRLLEPETATVVRVSGGDLLTTDGPFAESKEHLGGFYVIEAADLDAALVWASKTTQAVGQPVEVRPFWEMPDA